MESRLKCGRIHIIEWLASPDRRTGAPGDRRTGTEIYRAAKQLIAETSSGMDIILHRVSSRASFLARLERIEQDFRATGKIPLLEIETHGDLDGIGLSDENGMDWPELMRALIPLNMATGLRLPVVMASCHGIWGIKMAQPVERASFLALLGPNREVFPGEVVRGMSAFYRGVFEYKSGDRAMQMLNDIVDPTATTFESHRHYFMIDLYPENAARFNLEIAKVPEPEPRPSVRIETGGRVCERLLASGLTFREANTPAGELL